MELLGSCYDTESLFYSKNNNQENLNGGKNFGLKNLRISKKVCR